MKLSAVLPLLCAAGWAHVPLLRGEDRPDLVVADFEREKFGDWTATGEAFGPGPVGGAVPGQAPVEAFQGRKFVKIGRAHV